MTDYTTSSNPDGELPLADERAVSSLLGFVDSYPEDLYVKVYPRRLRDLIRGIVATERAKGHRKFKVTRAMIAALVLLGFRADKNGECHPGSWTSAAEVGLASASGSRYMYKRLRSAGLVSWDFDHNKRSRRFHVPRNIFVFGVDSYRDQNFATGSDQNFATGSRQNFDANKSHGFKNKSHEDVNPTNHARSALPVETNAEIQSQTYTRTQEVLYRKLRQIGVTNKESAIIAVQYHPQTIESAITDANRLDQQGKIKSSVGAWVRATVARRAGGQPLWYDLAGQSAARQLMQLIPLTSPSTPSLTTPPAPQSMHPSSATPSKSSSDPLMSARYKVFVSLKQAGVRATEADLIAQQWTPEDVTQVINESERGQVANRGAWIRRVLERRSGREIAYPSPSEIMRRQAVLVDMPTPNPYLANPYDRYEADEDDQAERRAMLLWANGFGEQPGMDAAD